MSQPEWRTTYTHPNEGPLAAVKVGNLVSYNDGDLCNAACIDFILKTHFADTSPICVDIGVDKGWWSKFCLQQSPTCQIYAFEPNPTTFQALQETFQGDSRINLFQKAISKTDTQIYLTLDGENSNSRQADGGTLVETTTLDFLFEKHQQLDIVKIDTEGHEWTIFQSLKGQFPRIHTLLFEFSVYWYGGTKTACIERACEMLLSIFQEYPYVYSLSRRGEPNPERIESEDDAIQFVYNCYHRHFQTDILASRVPMFDTVSVMR
jgi:FkbM family methyltransferase